MFASYLGFASGFSTSPVVGGIFRWNADCSCSTVSNCSKNELLQAFPNPVLGVLNIYGKNITRIIISDFSGKQIFSNDYAAVNRINENIESLDDGVYMVRVFTDKVSSVIKIIKQ